MPKPSETIVVFHSPSLDPRPIISRLLEQPIDDDVVPWHIDNKYYTATVQLHLVQLGRDDSIHVDGDVVMYLFDHTFSTLPTSLLKLLMDQPKDITLAIKVAGPDQDKLDPRISTDDMEDIFAEVGMELIDEGAISEDDGRPISPLESIRQTLMTHMWPNMIRKPLSARDNPQLPLDEEEGIEEEDQSGPSTFPIQFNASETNEAIADAAAFPNMNELKTQLEMDQLDRFDSSKGLARLELIDAMGGPGDDEYARLDDWLDEDEDGFVQLDQDGDDVIEPGQTISHQHETSDDNFDDDFDDFAAYQSAPQSNPTLSLDPTPLLLHLQSVRTELAGVSDEDERRLRAGEEVARVMRDLGLGGGFDDLEFDDDSNI